MRKTTILFLALLPVLLSGCMSLGSISLTAPGVKWKDSYSFDRSNVFKIDFYAKNNELLRTQNYRTYFQSAGDDFVTKMIPDGKSLAIETVIDKTNMVAIQIFGAGAPGSTYNAGRFK